MTDTHERKNTLETFDNCDSGTDKYFQASDPNEN